MLKIKDNIDLKELEKFGFEKGILHYVFSGEELGEPYKIVIRCEPLVYARRIFLHKDDLTIPNVIFDLIQAGLVEKVEV